MAWRITKVEEQRKEFIRQVQMGDRTITDLCNEYQISRKTGYKWINRYEECGDNGLKNKSKAPHSQPCKTNEKLTQKILEIKQKYPGWGPKKVLATLKVHHPGVTLPSDTTVGNILHRHGLVIPRKYRKRMPAKTDPLSHCCGPNDVWSVDFKGWFITKDKIKCDPLTVSDAYARYILYCSKLHSGREFDVWKVLEELFYENGLPKFMRHDNGPPFATTGAGRLSALSVKLIKTGVVPEWIEPGKPYQNGRHERMHKTLQAEGVFPLQLTLKEQQMKFREFIQYFNYERPHEALGQQLPGNVYVRSDRTWDGQLRSPEYDNGSLVKWVRSKGQVSWNGVDIYIGKTLKNEYIAFQENDDGNWAAYYGPVFLGIIDSKNNFITPREVSRLKRSYQVRCY